MLCTRSNTHCVTLAQDADSTETIFEIARLFWDRGIGPAKPELRYTSRRQLKTRDTNATFSIGTAGSEAFGRGQTLQRVHGSECAHWPSRVDTANLVAGLTEAASHGEIVLETTANGQTGWYYEEWRAAESGSSDFAPIFIPWYVGRDNRLPITSDAEYSEIRESLTDEESNAVERYGLDLEQLKWRRRKQHALRRLYQQEYPETPGQAFLTSGAAFFDQQTVSEMYATCAPPIETRENGRILIWRHPEPGHRYIVGVDCSEGLPDGDYSAALVLDHGTFEQVAELHGRWRPRDFAIRVNDIARQYNDAYLAIEKASAGHSVIDIVYNDLSYPRPSFFRHEVYDKTGARASRLGWLTNAETRPLMLSDMDTAISERAIRINSTRLLDECRSFDSTRKPGRYEAASGYHDDLVMAAAIAIRVRAIGRPGAPTLA